MIRAGFVIDNPITHSRTTVLESDAETQGMSWLLEVSCVPNSGPDIPEHVHLTWTERFEIVQGTAHFSVEGSRKTAQAGESFIVLPGQRHIHPWNAGDGVMVFRQCSEFGAPTPQAVQDVLGVFATIADLARQGQVDRRGMPRNPLQLAATMRTLTRYGGYDTSVPQGVQRLIGSTLGRMAEWLGYHGVDSQYRGA